MHEAASTGSGTSSCAGEHNRAVNSTDSPLPEDLEQDEREVAELKAICAALVDAAGNMVRLIEELTSADAAAQIPAMEA